MRNIYSQVSMIFIIILLILILSGLTWANYKFSTEYPGGKDFIVQWVGTQELIYKGISPYSDDVEVKIQTIANSRFVSDINQDFQVVYPLYSTIIFAPFAVIQDYNLARALWMSVLEVSIFLIALISLSLTDWKPGIGLFVLYLLFTFIWYHSVYPVIIGNASVLVSLFVVTAFWAIIHRRDELAGILLVLSMIKPDVTFLLWIFATIWGISKRRWRLLIWSYGTLLVFAILGMVIFPDWILQYIAQIINFADLNLGTTPGEIFKLWFPGIGHLLGWGLTIIMGFTLLVEWFSAWKKDVSHFLWTACLTIVISLLIGVQTELGNYIILYFPLIYVIGNLQTRWGKSAGMISIILMLILNLGMWYFVISTTNKIDQSVNNSLLFFIIPFVVLVGLYWIRWWVTRPKRPLVEALKSI